jgi:NADPH:quinone reductase-like Zn-dependent oxidoreductase
MECGPSAAPFSTGESIYAMHLDSAAEGMTNTHLDFVRRLGADQVIDYHAQRFEDVIDDVSVH